MERMTPNHGHLVGLGEHQEVTPSRQLAGDARLDSLSETHARMGAHLWTVILCHLASDAILDAMEGVTDGLPMLDVETLLGRPYVGCYNCESAYEPRARRRKCPGVAPA